MVDLFSELMICDMHFPFLAAGGIGDNSCGNLDCDGQDVTRESIGNKSLHQCRMDSYRDRMCGNCNCVFRLCRSLAADKMDAFHGKQNSHRLTNCVI